MTAGAMGSFWRRAAAVGALLGGAGAAYGDMVVRQKVIADVIAMPSRIDASGPKCDVTVEHPAGGESLTVTLGDDRARRDCDHLSVILRRDRGALYLLYPHDRKYSEMKFPVRPKDVKSATATTIPSELRRFRVEIEYPAEEATIGSWPAARSTVRLVNGLRERRRVTVAVARALVPDPGLVADLRASLEILRGAVDDWTALLPARTGLPVLWEEGEIQPETEFLYREEVVAVEKREVPAGTYEVPEGFTRTRFAGECVRLR